MARGKPHGPKTKAMALEMLAEGKTPRAVSREINVPASTVYDWFREWAGTPGFERARVERELEDAIQARHIRRVAGHQLLRALAQGEISADKLATVWAIAVDKSRLLDGQAIGRIEHRFAMSEEEQQQMHERLFELLEAEQRYGKK